MGWREWAQHAAAVASGDYVRLDVRARVVSLAPAVVEPAVLQALSRVPGLVESSVEVLPDGVHLEGRVSPGLRVAATVVPRKLELHGETLRAYAHLPEGLQVGHENAALGLALGLFDGMLGASERLVGQYVPGASLHDGAFTYSRPVGELSLLRRLRQMGWQLDSRGTIHLAVRDGWLQLDLRDALPLSRREREGMRGV